MKDVENERAESDERCRESVYQNFYGSHEFPPTLDGTRLSLLRSKSLLSINGTIRNLVPHLLKQVNSKTSQDGIELDERPEHSQQINNRGKPRRKRVEKSFRVVKTKLQDRVSPTKKNRPQADAGGRKTPSVGLRKSPRSHKSLSSLHD